MDDKIKNQLEEKINTIIEEGIQMNNLDMLGKLVDIHKDIANEDYWTKKKEVMDMRYREDYSDYGNYGREEYGEYSEYGRRGVPGTGRGRRRRYSARGMDDKYRGEEMMDNMYGAYQDYSEGKERYGHHTSTMKSLDYMLKSVVQFIEMLKEDASSQEEMQLIQKYTREISDM